MPYWEEIAATLERGSFDALFLADNVGAYGNDPDSIKYGNHIVYALWDSFEPDAMLMDHEGRVMTDPTEVHRIDFEGRWHRSAGPTLSVVI